MDVNIETCINTAKAESVGTPINRPSQNERKSWTRALLLTDTHSYEATK